MIQNQSLSQLSSQKSGSRQKRSSNEQAQRSNEPIQDIMDSVMQDMTISPHVIPEDPTAEGRITPLKQSSKQGTPVPQ